ncbi:MAG: hypothetical protein ACYC1F_05205 [Gallionellaceae bacterium]
MANHAHRQIREAVATLLTGLTTTGSRVYPNRLHPLTDANLPGLRVFMDDEEVIGSNIDKTQDRRLALIVECCAKASADLDDMLDASSNEVEVALSGGITIGGNWIDAEYTGMQFDDAMAEKPAGVKRLRFFITYTAASNAPDVLI